MSAFALTFTDATAQTPQSVRGSVGPSSVSATKAGIGAPRIVPGLERRLTRLRRYRTRMAVLDAALITAATAATTSLQLTAGGQEASATNLGIVAGGLLLAAAWIVALIFVRAPGERRGGMRFQVKPVVLSAAMAFGTLGIMEGLTGWPELRLHVLVTLPAAICALVSARFVRRMRLARRTRSELAPRTVVVGRRDDIENAIRSLTRGGQLGHNIVGATVSDGSTAPITVDGIDYPVLGDISITATAARSLCAETVVMASATDDPAFVRRLAWSLEGAATNLVLATRLTDVARSRITSEQVSGLALTHVALPRFDRTSMRAKRVLDITVAVLALIPIAILTPFIAAAIRIDSPGDVFFRQRRIGHDGREFEILKFRTMCQSAEADRALLEAHNEGSGPLFKMKSDPRVTRVGAVLRKFSLDELPQFWNVLTGDMSVVGPRPPLPAEVLGYEENAVRRLYVQPGITGLWQVSGRSDLSWEQSVRLDLDYVENWSVATDLRIILRTAAVMVRPQGAY